MKKTLVMQALVGMALVCGACERHSWNETKALHEEHGGGHGAAAGEHAASPAEHGGDGAHGAEKAEH